MTKWKCYRCGEVYDQEAPPEICKTCNAQVSFWIDWTDAKTNLDEPVSKFMSRELITIDINHSVLEAARLMNEYKTGSVFVTQNGDPVGILTERDVLYKIVAEDLPPAHVLLRKVMSSPLVSIEEETPSRTAMELMRDKGFRRLLVTNKGKPSGLVTQGDLAAHVL